MLFSRVKLAVLVALGLAVAGLAAAGPSRAASDPWQKDANWISVRAGQVRMLTKDSPDGYFGYGVSYQRFLSNRISLGFSVDHDVLGRFGPAAEIEVPFALEYLAHFKWKTAVHPSIGVGFAAVYHHTYRSGLADSEFQPGAFLSAMLSTPVSERAVLSVQWRMTSVSSDDVGVDPTFGKHLPSSGRSSLKLSVSRVYW